MRCKCCGAEIPSDKRFCPKCGMPHVDYGKKPEAEEEDNLVDIAKKIRDLAPEVKKFEDKKEEEKEKRRKEKEEALRKMYEEEEDEEEVLYSEDDDEEDEDFDDEDDYDDEEDDDDDFNDLDERKHKLDAEKSDHSVSDDEGEEIPDILYDETEDKDRFYYTVTRAVEDAYALEDTEITIKGNVCYLDFHEESAVFNIEDEDNSIKCIINYPKEEIEYNDMVYDFEYTKIIIETLQRGDHVNVKGRIEMENEDDAVFHVIEVEGDGFFIRCEA